MKNTSTIVLRRLAKAGLRLKREKCVYLLSSVDYLGHTICEEGLLASNSKVAGIVKAPALQNVTKLRSFLELMKLFLPDLARVLSPLYALLQKRKKQSWSAKEEQGFEEVKTLLQSSRVLVHYDPQLPIILECEASPYGLGAVLSHQLCIGEEKPVAFTFHMLTLTEQKYSHLDKEALAII